MSNKNLAMTLQYEHEDEFDNISSDVELMKRAQKLAHEEFSITNEDAIKIGREVLKLYDEVEER